MAQKENLLDYVPRHNKLYPWHFNKEGHVEVQIEHVGPFHKIAQVFFKRPRYSDIELEDMGSFIWQQIDGQKTVFEIGKLLHEEFGDRAEPLYDRLGAYIQSLHLQKFIVYENKLQKEI